MNISKVNYSALNCMKSNCTGLNVFSMDKKKANMEKSVMDAMVLWYDLAKQGATNESMQANPVLADHSGNGHDAACGNFAWSGMSGIGGYLFNYNVWINDGTTLEGVQVVKNDHQMIFNSFGTKFRGNIGYEYVDDTDKFASYTLRVTNIPANGLDYFVSIKDEGGEYLQTLLSLDLHEGDNIIPEVEIPSTYTEKILVRILLKTISEDISAPLTIEQLPLYPNALVFDGVDDMASCPAFHLGKDWTLLFDIAWMDKVKASAGISKNPNFFVYNNRTGDELSCFINRISNAIAVPNTIICMNSQLGFIDRDYSIIEDTGEQTVTSGSESIIMFGYNGANFITMALRKLLLFNRALSIDEIKWVKTNLM